MHRLGLLLLLMCAMTGSVRAADAPEKFVVFFQEWSAAIDDQAQDVVTHAADWVKSHPGNVARVSGFASPTGSRQANVLMADLRAQRVVDQLQADGVDGKRIKQRGRGPVPFAISEQESRRVEITIGRR